jgi:hypothetical protein
MRVKQTLKTALASNHVARCWLNLKKIRLLAKRLEVPLAPGCNLDKIGAG